MHRPLDCIEDYRTRVELKSRHGRSDKDIAAEWPLVAVEWLYPRCVDLRHSTADEVSQDAWSVDFGLAEPSSITRTLYTLVDEKMVTYVNGRTQRKCKGRVFNGVATDWLPESEVLKTCTPLQPGMFHALWNLCYPTRDNAQPALFRKRPVLFSRVKALRLFPTGTLNEKSLKS